MRNAKVLTALLALTLSATALAVIGAPAGSTITNTATMDFLDDSGATQNATSDVVTTTVAQVAGISIVPGTPTVYAEPGNAALLSYTLTNTGNATDTFTLGTILGSGVDASKVAVYIDSNDNGILDASERVNTTTSGPIAQEAQRKLWVSYTIPTTTLGGVNFDLSPTGTSTFDTAATDTNNTSRVTTINVHNLDLIAAGNATVTSPGTVTFANSFANTGNVPLNPAVIDFSVTNPGGWAVSYNINGGANYSTPKAALNAYGPVPVGATVTLNAIMTAPNGLNAGDTNTLTTSAYFTAADTATTNYVDETTSPDVITTTATIVKGKGVITKTGINCGADLDCATNAPITSAAPGELLRYTITVRNDGTSALNRVRLNDSVPTFTKFFASTVTTTQPGTVLYSSTGTTWSTTRPLNAGDTGSLYVGIDTNGDGTITTLDHLDPGRTIVLTFDVVVNKY